MEYITFTKFLIVFIIITLVIYDLFIVIYAGPRPTLSRVILLWSIEYPLIPFLVGVLIGHLFSYQEIIK